MYVAHKHGTASIVPLRGEVKLKLETATKRRQNIEWCGDGKRQQQQQREGLTTTVFQVDTVLGPGDDTSEARSTIPNTAATLVARYIAVVRSARFLFGCDS